MMKTEICKQVKKLGFTEIFLVFSIMLMGLFHEFLSCIAGIAICIYLMVLIKKRGKLFFYTNIASVAVLAIVLFYGLSIFWAVDKGDAVIGFFKFLPLALFIILVMQRTESTDVLLRGLPICAVFMTVISAILMQIPALKNYFSVAGRLSGFFQYANTFALFLIIGLIIIATKENLAVMDYVMFPILIFGIIYSGSRTAFALLIFTVLALALFKKNNKHRLLFTAAVIIAVAVAAVYALVTDNFYSIGRFLTISLKESTFVGRLLYYRDALPIILRHPFGLGFLGYSYMQNSFQTGVYTVRYIHNDFLQLTLDIGWGPTLLFVAAIIKSFFKKGSSFRKRLLLLVISAHTCFDFNFQYVAIFIIFILLLDYKDGIKKEIRLSKTALMSVGIVISVLFSYIGLSQAFFYFKQYDIANSIYPFSTRCKIAMMQLQNREDAIITAEKIIDSNEYVYLAYRVKAGEAYSNGDFKKVIEYENKAIELSPFTYETYEEYCYMLINGIYLYNQAGDRYSSSVCEKELVSTVNKLQFLSDKQSKLGKMIKDQPKTELPEEIMNYVEEFEKK